MSLPHTYNLDIINKPIETEKDLADVLNEMKKAITSLTYANADLRANLLSISSTRSASPSFFVPSTPSPVFDASRYGIDFAKDPYK